MILIRSYYIIFIIIIIIINVAFRCLIFEIEKENKMNDSSLKQRKIEITNNDNESIASDYLDESKYKKFDDKQQQIESLFSQSILFASNQSNSSDDSSSSSMTIENFLWFLASIVLIYFTDIFNVILYDTTIYRYAIFIFNLTYYQ
jgi:hypothetical protein